LFGHNLEDEIIRARETPKLSDPVEPEVVTEELPDQPAEIDRSKAMEDYYALLRELTVTTVILIGIVFPAVWYRYDVGVASNYLLGAFTGMVYLRLLGRNVEKLGQGGAVGKSQVAVFAGVMIAAAKIEQLSILPIFLGFMTFKAGIFVYTLRYVNSARSRL
jgi:ATP synthase protein I